MRAFLLVLFVPGLLGAWPLPPPLETAHLLGKGLPSGNPPVPLTDEFYSLGWSRDNAFGYMEVRTVGDERLARVRIQDLVEDSIIWEQEWPAWSEDASATVDAAFARYGLQKTNWQLGVFPLILDNEFYTLALRKTFVAGWLDRWEVVVHSTGRGLKSLGEASGYWRWATLLGFIPSPFENRLALILLVQPSGWQGIKQPLRFLVTGLSLKAGFPKP